MSGNYQQIGIGEELSVNGLGGIGSSVTASSSQPQQSPLPIQSNEINQEYVEEKITLQYNEESSLQSSSRPHKHIDYYEEMSDEIEHLIEVAEGEVDEDNRHRDDISGEINHFKFDQKLKDKVDDDRTFSQKSNMKLHYMSHTGQYPHVCEYCSKRFRTPSELVIHIRTHTGERAFKCPFENCNKIFSQKCNMKLHQRSHTGQIPHVCPLCLKRFRNPFVLKIHTRTHTGEKPHKCPFDNCNRTFSQKGSMNLHHMSHTGQLSHVCAHCPKSFRTSFELRIHTRIHEQRKAI